MNNRCQYLEWDSSFFGRRIARVVEDRLTESSAADILSWCAGNAIDCLYFLAVFDDVQTLMVAQANAFRLTDARLTLDMPLKTRPVDDIAPRIRHWRDDDLPTLRAIARASHHDTRFYYDLRFPREQCDALYEAWIENSCHGFADAVLVAEVDGRPAGYITCTREGVHGKIGLFSVSADARGRGLGSQLIGAAAHWFALHEVEQISVVTQARNVGAQRVYQRAGFLTRSVQLWYHRWFDG